MSFQNCQPGDVIMLRGNDAFNRMYSTLCWRPWHWFKLPDSHTGIVVKYDGQLCLMESTTLSKHRCKIAGQTVSGVQVIPICERIGSYNGTVHVCRLSYESRSKVSASKVQEDNQLWIDGITNRPIAYDWWHAIWSGVPFGRLFLYLSPYPTTSKMFCSELVMRILSGYGLHTRPSEGWNPAAMLWFLRKYDIVNEPERIK